MPLEILSGIKLHNEFCKPCAYCNGHELVHLQETYAHSEEEHWEYELECECVCNRCIDRQEEKARRKQPFLPAACALLYASFKLLLWHYFETALYCALLAAYVFYHIYASSKPNESKIIRIPIPLSTVGTVERAVNAASAGKKGAEFRPHATFVHHLTLLGVSELHKQALCSWAPLAMRKFMDGAQGVTRRYLAGRPSKSTESPTLNPMGANPDIEDGKMPGVLLDGNEYGEEKRVTGEESTPAEETQCATQIGPDLIPTEAFSSTHGNLKAGVAKRVKPPPYKGTSTQERKILKVTNALMEHVFPRQKIIRWREENPEFDEFKSKKWSERRWKDAVIETLTDLSAKIEQEAQIKKNEALPSKGKAPRPIIQTGDKGQVIMSFAVKCFEELLFEYFEEASIKHCAKYEAMLRVASHLRQENANVIEGDGSAWDSCCSFAIRKQTENRIIKHIINVLGQDAEVPATWLNECLNDMDKPMLKMKTKLKGNFTLPSKVFIESIRQSGHRGTSCFNWLINFTCWLVVMAKNPENLIPKNERGKLRTEYISAHDGNKYSMKYAFEGDDSAISTTENVKAIEEKIMEAWTKLGFNMKLIYAKKTFTFTGFNFLCDEQGPMNVCVPEMARNIASSSWSCSSELLSFPEKTNQVGAAAMLARAENFKECGPFSAYFASLGLAHIQQTEDFGLQEAQALSLGLNVCNSVKEELELLYINAKPLQGNIRKLVREILPTFNHEQEQRMLSSSFTDPLDTSLAKTIVPFELWDPSLYEAPRRRNC